MASGRSCPGATPASRNWWFRAASGSRGEKAGFNSPPSGSLVYTPIDQEAIANIRSGTTRSHHAAPSSQSKCYCVVVPKVLPVLDAITAAAVANSDTVFFGPEIRVPRAAPGWIWLVAHIIRLSHSTPSDLVKESATLQVDVEKRRRLCASHTASHLFSAPRLQSPHPRFLEGISSKARFSPESGFGPAFHSILPDPGQ